MPTQVKLLLNTADGSTPPSTIEHIIFNGDGVAAGFAPGVDPPPWLNVTVASHTDSTADFLLGLNLSDVPGPGTYTTSLRFVTGHLNGSNDISNATDITFVDVPVSFVVSDFTVDPATLSYEAISGSAAQPTPSDVRTFSIAGTELQWSATSSQPWLSLSQSGGSSATVVPFVLDAAGLSFGRHDAAIAVQNAPSGETKSVAVALNVRAPRLVVSPMERSYTINVQTTSAALTQSVSVSDEIGGNTPALASHWTIAIDQPWLAASASSGDSAPSSNVRLTVKADQLPQLANGDYVANVTFNYTDSDGATGNVVVPVTMHLSLPRVRYVGPYIAYANESGAAILQGSGFLQPGTLQIRFGSAAPASASVAGDTNIKVTTPALPVGTYNVAISNALGLSLSTGRFVVINHQNLPAATIVQGRSNAPNGDVYDAERTTLYIVDSAGGMILRYLPQGETWSASIPIPLPNAVAAQLSADGRLLLLATTTSIYELDLTAPGATPVLHETIPPSTSGNFFIQSIAMTNRNVALVTARLQFNASTEVFEYDLSTHHLGPSPFGDATIVASVSAYSGLDGSKVALAVGGVSPPGSDLLYDSSIDQIISTPVSDLAQGNSFISVNRNASRYITDTHGVLGPDFGQLGSVQWHSENHFPDGTTVTIVSPDGTRAYTFVAFSSPSSTDQIFVSDLTANTVNGVYPVIKTITLPVAINPPSVGTPAMSMTPDGTTLFICGGSYVVVIKA